MKVGHKSKYWRGLTLNLSKSIVGTNRSSIMKHIILAVLILFSFNVLAKKNYVSGSQRVTFRTGPSVENKVLKMIESEEAVDVISVEGEWSKVKDSEGREGYILNRFLTSDIPYSVRYKWLNSQMDKLKESSGELATKSAEQEAELQRLAEVEKEYNQLKIDSADFIALRKKYDQAIVDARASEAEIKELSSKVSTIYIKWFLAGAGVLLLGFIMGSIGRKKKAYGSSIKL